MEATLCNAWSVLQDVIMESSDVAAALALREPVCVSVRTGETSGVYAQLVEAAMAPERYIPLTPTLEVRRLIEKLQLHAAIRLGRRGVYTTDA